MSLSVREHSDETRSVETLSQDRQLSQGREYAGSFSSARTERDLSLQEDLVVQSHQGQIADHDLTTYKSKETTTMDENFTGDDFDGGYGWFVVLGAFMVQFTAFGTASSWGKMWRICAKTSTAETDKVPQGIMQNYFERSVFNHLSDAQLQLSFVGTFMEMFVDLMGPVVQILSSKFGIKFVLVAGTFLMALGLELASVSSEIWHLYLTQGLLFGTGASFLFVTVVGITPRWFNRRRGLALDLASSGSGIGGLVLPFILTPLNNSLGIGWAYRVLGFICLGCDVVSCVLVKERVPQYKGENKHKLSQIFSKDVFKDANFVLWVIASMIGLMGFFVPYFFLPSYATYLGMSSTDSSACITVMSASNFIGRIAVGYLGDRIGRLNAHILYSMIAGLSCLLIWTFAESYGVLMAFAVVFGFFCASYFSLLSPITATIIGMERYPTAISVLLLSNVISVYGPSIASAVESTVRPQPYLTYKVFTGVVYLLGFLLLVVLKLRMTKSILARI